MSSEVPPWQRRQKTDEWSSRPGRYVCVDDVIYFCLAVIHPQVSEVADPAWSCWSKLQLCVMLKVQSSCLSFSSEEQEKHKRSFPGDKVMFHRKARLVTYPGRPQTSTLDVAWGEDPELRAGMRVFVPDEDGEA